MAHFAKLNDDNEVIEINVVNNEVLDPSNEEASGIAFLTEWSGGYTNWKQTSYNNNFRKQYAGIGMLYNAELDMFVTKQPFDDWTLDSSGDWQAPIPKPDDGKLYRWTLIDSVTGEYNWVETNLQSMFEVE